MEFDAKIKKSWFWNFDVLYAKVFQFDSANTILNRGNTSPNKEGGPFSDTGDSPQLFRIPF
jgi:hypothetical protein